jgi:hypothetical protein
MRILDKHKDYYDHLAGVYGIDNTVFFDRRGSTKLTQNDLLNAFLRYDQDWAYEPETTVKRIKAGTKDIHAIVEAGYFQYLLHIVSLTIKSHTDRYIPEVDGTIELIHTFDDHKHYFPAPINLYPVSVGRWYSRLTRKQYEAKRFNYSNDIHPEEKGIIENPIFIDTKIPSILDAHTIYVNLFDYIASKADFDIVDTRGDVAKAVDHGFDKKTSFRNM